LVKKIAGLPNTLASKIKVFDNSAFVFLLSKIFKKFFKSLRIRRKFFNKMGEERWKE
jgi:hypothetical protein